MQQLSAKPAEDFTLTISSRIEQHKKAEEEKVEAQRKRMEEEPERANAEKLAKLEAEQRESIRLEELAKIEAAKPVVVAPVEAANTAAKAIADFTRSPAPAAKPQTPPTLTLGNNQRTVGFTVSGAFLQSLGFESVKVKSRKPVSRG